MAGKKWSAAQKAKFKATIKAKRDKEIPLAGNPLEQLDVYMSSTQRFTLAYRQGFMDGFKLGNGKV